MFERADGLEVVELTGGISAAVFAVRGEASASSSSRRWRASAWRTNGSCRKDRALAEAEALELMAGLAPGSVPRLLDVDSKTFTLVMEEAPAGWRPWKALCWRVRRTRRRCPFGTFLSTLHASDADIGSAESFDAQRVDPYLRTIQGRHPSRGPNRRVRRAAARDAAMSSHGDYSPKNVLVGDDGLWVIDWEIVHRGDPAFDVAFLLNHLLLKTIHRPQAREGYEACGRAFLDAYDSRWTCPTCSGSSAASCSRVSTGSRPPSTSPSRSARPRVLQESPSSAILRRRSRRRGQVFDRQPVHDAVDPLAVALVRAPLATLEHEARTLGVAHGPLVEAVDLELEPVEAELVEEMSLEEPRGLVRDLPAAEVRVDGEATEVGDPVRPPRLEAHDAGTVAVHLDHEHPEHVGLS